MLIVPVAKDKVRTTDGHEYRVISYTNYKDGGPAVYCKDKTSTSPVLVYFFDIDQVNGTNVEYQRGSRVFRALGKVKREFHLPQPDDKVTVLTNKVSDEDGKERVDVDGLKLKSKALGVNKGIFFKDTDGNAYRLNQILDIDRALGGERFNREAFLAYYKDYTGV